MRVICVSRKSAMRYSVCVIIGKNDDVKISFARQKVHGSGSREITMSVRGEDTINVQRRRI